MARGKAISVKIATTKVIKALETKLAEVKADYANQDKLQEKHKKAVEKWSKDVAKLAMSAIAKAEDLSANTRYNGEINVNFSLPKGTIELPTQPEQDFKVMHQWQFKETCEEIENAIRILKMTDEEVVNTSTYNAIAQYL
jgi:hypothetical protein